MKQLWVCLCVIGCMGGSMAWAQLPQIEDYSGDLWSRPALTGDWGGFRNTMAKKGINLDVDLVQGVQGLNSGGLVPKSGQHPLPLWRACQYTLNVDTGKLGLWPGGFLSILGESQFGSYLRGKKLVRYSLPTPPRSTLFRSMIRPRSPASCSPNFWPSGSASSWARSTLSPSAI